MSAPHLETLGWSVIEERDHSDLWRDAEGDLLGLARVEDGIELSREGDPESVARLGRTLAESMDSSLVEASVLDHVEGRSALLVCRRLEDFRLVFTGVLIVPTRHGSWMWSMVAKGEPATRDLRDLCDDCRCVAHPLARVRRELRKLLTVKLESS